MFGDLESGIVAQYLPDVNTLQTPRHPDQCGIAALRASNAAHGRGDPGYRFMLTSGGGNKVRGLPGFHARVAVSTAPRDHHLGRAPNDGPGARVYFIMREGASGCVALRIRADVWAEYHSEAPECRLIPVCNRAS